MTLLDSIGLQDVKGMLQFRIRPDSDLLEAIQEALDREKVKAGVFVSGLGALKKAVFRNLRRFPEQYPVTPEDRIYLEVTSPMELVALSGWVAPRADGRPRR